MDAAKAAKMASYSDGSVESDLPMQQLSELFNVNHFIVSQVNPHSAMLTSMSLQASIWTNPLYRALVGYARFLKDQSKDWLKNVLNLFIFRSNAPVWSAKRGLIQTLTQVRDPVRMLSFVHLLLYLSQEYEGRECDVTIMPWTGHISPYTALLSTIKVHFCRWYLIFFVITVYCRTPPRRSTWSCWVWPRRTPGRTSLASALTVWWRRPWTSVCSV